MRPLFCSILLGLPCVRLCMLRQFKAFDHLLEHIGLARQFSAGRSTLFCCGRVALHHSGDLHHSLIHLIQLLCDLLIRICDLGHPLHDLLCIACRTLQDIRSAYCNFAAASTASTERWISTVVFFAASALLAAKLRTSSATTAKPLPAAPALAASTAAFKARMLVRKAISQLF